MTEAKLSSLRADITATKHIEEHSFVKQLLEERVFDTSVGNTIEQVATSLVNKCRDDTKNQSLLDSFLQEYGLSNQEGVALMCLAEALLRVPDHLTADRLIAEKLSSGEWLQHIGKSGSWTVNAATWGLVLTGKIVMLDAAITQQPKHWLKRLTARLSQPIVRTAVLQAMKFMGSQYVLGRTIDEGIAKAEKHTKKIKKAQPSRADIRLSFDMLGEGARTQQDAARYFAAYADALQQVGALNDIDNAIAAHGVSVKLSALHPQYHHAHQASVITELLPKVTELAIIAKRHNIGLSIDAEEAARLEMSLDIFQALCENPELADWHGLGFVMQAYQKRAPAVAKWLIALGEVHHRTIPVRLVKGAYWDTEIKHAQEQGLSDYPVFTRKVNTDVCYLHCAKTLLSSKAIYAQFATHNAHTAVAVGQLADEMGVTDYEFQRLHGMGELMYKHLLDDPTNATEPTLQYTAPLRIYAPIGQHRDLLPYLVRRLLENGANSSFVNRFLDADTSPQSLVKDCYAEARAHQSQSNQRFRHSGIPLPKDIFNSTPSKRTNANGLDLDDHTTTSALIDDIQSVRSRTLTGHSIVNGQPVVNADPPNISLDPSNTKQAAGVFHTVDDASIELALESAFAAHAAWQDAGAKHRASILQTMADLLEQHCGELVGLVNREAGRTIADGVSEVREAVDFCRYYAEQASLNSARPAQGVFLCISPWNFPLAIFVGQVSAALSVGNCVLAKPADPTPIVATRVTQLFHQAGVPVKVLHLLIGDGPSIGAKVLPDPRLGGVAFTGSNHVAKTIHTTLLHRDGPSTPFIAETGGQNCMVVDSTALPEQVVDDVIASAFHSAGQRCSALRVLYLPDVIADSVWAMLEGALALVNVGSPEHLNTDVGPIIDETARAKLQQHANRMEPLSKRSIIATLSENTKNGVYFAPRVYEIDSINALDGEIFGPILHVIRYKTSDLERVINEVNSTGYGLTFGVHSRIDAFANHLFKHTRAGNTYVNRNTIGAVVGVNPFGGRGLSGTGPKAGGPRYVLTFQRACQTGSPFKSAELIERIHSQHLQIMPGPTGEMNEVISTPIGNVLLVLNEQTPLKELAAALNILLALGNTATVTVRNIANRAQLDAVLLDIPEHHHQQIQVNEENVLARASNPAHQAVIAHRSHPNLPEFKRRISQREGAIIPLIEFDESVLLSENLDWYISQFCAERTKTDNLVAKGGNTQLFNLESL